MTIIKMKQLEITLLEPNDLTKVEDLIGKVILVGLGDSGAQRGTVCLYTIDSNNSPILVSRGDNCTINKIQIEDYMGKLKILSGGVLSFGNEYGSLNVSPETPEYDFLFKNMEAAGLW